MKLAIIILSLIVSFTSLAANHELPFTKNEIQAKEVTWTRPLLINFMKLYHKVNLEKRMIASEKSSYLDNLRSKLKGVNGPLRL